MPDRRRGWSAAGTVVVLVVTSVLASSCTGRRSSTAPGPAHPSVDRSTTTVAPTTSSPPSPGTAVPTTTAPPDPGWTAPLTTLPPGGGFTSLSCLSDTFCIAVGGGASGSSAALTAGSGVTTSWDGAAWSGPSVYLAATLTGPVTAPVLPTISCSTGPTCAIVDGSGHGSSGDGTTWSTPVAVPFAPSPAPNPFDPGTGHAGSRSAAVSCPSARECAVIDNTGQAITFHAGIWTSARSFTEPGPDGRPVSLFQPGRVGVSCPSPEACTAVVGTSVLDWDGSSWSMEQAPWTSALPAGNKGTAIDCPTTTLCAVVSGSGLAYRNGVTAWSPLETVDPHGILDGISCPTTTFCLAVDTGGSVVTWDGSTWSTPVRVVPETRIYTGIGTSVSCPSSTFCMVMNADGDYATYTG